MMMSLLVGIVVVHTTAPPGQLLANSWTGPRCHLPPGKPDLATLIKTVVWREGCLDHWL